MPKRKNDNCDSIRYIKKKIKKLERKLLKGQRRQSSSSSLSDSAPVSNIPQDDIILESENIGNMIEDICQPGPSSAYATSVDPLPELDQPEIIHESLSDPVIEPPSTEVNLESQELDETMLEILGADPSTTPAFGKDIQKDLSIRFEFVATSGLTKELRKELLLSHLPPANCKLIDAPVLNPEIKAAVTEVIIKRDKALHAKQKQIGSAIASLSEAITILLSKEEKDPAILKLLIDTGRILCDSQHNDSITRRNFILAVLKKELKDQLQLTKIDNLLFGQELADTLKTAKAINKSGAELKSAPITKVSTNKPKPPLPNRNLNWKAPVPSRRLAGPQRAKEPARLTRQQHASSSRASRQNTNRTRR